jgi:hypothetical protein
MNWWWSGKKAQADDCVPPRLANQHTIIGPVMVVYKQRLRLSTYVCCTRFHKILAYRLPHLDLEPLKGSMLL